MGPKKPTGILISKIQPQPTMIRELLPFDIETRPDHDAVRNLYEFVPKLTTFDPSEVKTGNMNEQKAREKIHAKAKEFQVDKVNEEKEFWAELDDKAALNPMTAKIIVVGFINGNTIERLTAPNGANEFALINFFWKTYNDMLSGDRRRKELVGWAIEGFDIPFIIARSRILKIEVPRSVWPERYMNKIFVDLMKAWGCYGYGKFESLKRVAKALGVNRPRAYDITGANFWEYLEDNEETALVYHDDDLFETRDVAERIINNK